MKAIIADDELHLAEDLRRRLEQLWPELEIVAVLHDGFAAAEALTAINPDIAFSRYSYAGTERFGCGTCSFK